MLNFEDAWAQIILNESGRQILQSNNSFYCLKNSNSTKLQAQNKLAFYEHVLLKQTSLLQGCFAQAGLLGECFVQTNQPFTPTFCSHKLAFYEHVLFNGWKGSK